MSGKVFDLRGEVSANTSPFDSAMDKTAQSASNSFRMMSTAANAFIGSGVIRTFIKATDAANKFGQSLADISAIADYNLKSLRSSIMGMDNVYGRASLVADTMYETISSGVRGSAQELSDFVRITKQASVSIKADLYSTANVMTTLTNAYGLSTKEASKLSDMLYVTVREGKAHGNELARTLGLVANTAAESGVSLAELSAAISVLSRTQSASQSMIGLNQLLNSIIKPTQEAQREARYWGIELSATALKTKGLSGVLKELHDKTGGNVRALNAMLGNIRAMRAGVSLTGRQYENFVSILRTAEAEIGSGAAYGAFIKQTDTAAQSLENLKTQIDKTFIQAGTDLEPITRGLAKFAEAVLKAFGATDSISSINRWVMYAGMFATALSSSFKVIGGIYQATKSVSAAATAVNKSVGDTSGKLSVTDIKTKTVFTTVKSLRVAMVDVASAVDRVNASIMNVNESLRLAVLNATALSSQMQASQPHNLTFYKPVPEKYRDLKLEGTGFWLDKQNKLRDPKGRFASVSDVPKPTISKFSGATIVQQVQSKPEKVLERYNRRFGDRPGISRGSGQGIVQSVQSKPDAILKRYNRRFNTNLKSMPSSTTWRKFNATLSRNVGDFSGLSRAVSNVTSGLGKVLGTFGIWSAAASMVYTAAKALVDYWADKEVERIEKQTEAQGVVDYKKIAKRYLDSAESAGALAEGMYAAYLKEILLADSTSKLIDVTNKLAKLRQDKLDKESKTPEQVEKEAKAIEDKRQQAVREAQNVLSNKDAKQLSDRLQQLRHSTYMETEDLSRYNKEELVRRAASRGALAPEARSFTRTEYVSTPDVEAGLRTDAITRQHVALRMSDKMVGQIMEAFKGGDWKNAVEKLKTDITNQYANTPYPFEAQFRDSVLKVIDDLSKEREKLKAPDAVVDASKREANMTALMQQGELRSKGLKDFIYDEGITTRALAADPYDGMLHTLKDRVKLIADSKAQLADLDRTYGDLWSKGSEYGLSEQDIETALKNMSDRRTQLHSQLNMLNAGVDRAISEYVNAQVKEYNDELFDDRGVRRTIPLTTQDIIAARYVDIAEADSPESRKAQILATEKLSGIVDEWYADRDERLRNRATLRKEAGRGTEQDVLRTDVVAARRAYNRHSNSVRDIKHYQSLLIRDDEFDRARVLDPFIKKEQKKQEEAQLRLRAALIKLSDSATDAAVSIRTGLIKQVQDYASKRDASGTMTNDALYHSINLMSRLGGGSAIQTSKGLNMSIGRGKAANFKTAQDAQTAVSRSLDAYLMSQQYAEANKGKAVMDIYNLLKTNIGKGITVS